MNEEQLEIKMARIVDQMESLIMDIMFIRLKKINMENQRVQELQEIRMEERKEEFYNFGKTEPGSAGEQPGKG